MQEKDMVNNALSHINAGLTNFANMIAQSENQELRQTLQQMRDSAEKSQYELFNIAKSHNYYTPAQKASEQEIATVKAIANQDNASTNSGGMSGYGQSSGYAGQQQSRGTSGFSQSSGASGYSQSSGMSGYGQSSGMSGYSQSSGASGFGATYNQLASKNDDADHSALDRIVGQSGSYGSSMGSASSGMGNYGQSSGNSGFSATYNQLANKNDNADHSALDRIVGQSGSYGNGMGMSTGGNNQYQNAYGSNYNVDFLSQKDRMGDHSALDRTINQSGSNGYYSGF